ncbi:MAG: metallophosphoesterase [Clostridia bacterium]|nr:metallophosphoesterase [Clostridia bacterium]
MKIIHCADVHLGSRMNKFPKDKAEERAREVRASFERMITYAKREGIDTILLAGDIFDSDRPFKKDKEFFYSAVKRNSEITFFYLRGNHDGNESYTEEIENLKTFGGNWTSYTLGWNVVLSGIEMDRNNCLSMYSTLNLDPDNLNIVMLHGQAGDSSGDGKINLLRLKNKGIDYLALGHVHTQGKKPLDERGISVYSGCLEGRGFDETGEKGFMVYDTDTKEVNFVPFAYRTIEEIDIDISGTQDGYGAEQKIKSEIKIDEKNLLRLNLTGEIDFVDENLALDVEKYISDMCYFVSVKDNTRLKIDYSAFKDSLSLKGEFVRLVSGAELDDEDRQKILDIGMKALSGERD